MTWTAAPDSDHAARIHRLWDEMADFDAAHLDAALEHLLRTLSQLVDAQNAIWLGAVLLPESAGDALNGWRPRLYRFLHPDPRLEAAIREIGALIEQREIDVSVACRVALGGQLRTHRLEDIVPAGWFESHYSARFFPNPGYVDAIFAGCPVNAHAEVHLSLFRATGKPRFTAAECDTVHAALRSLRWFHRQYLLSHGLPVSTTLTAAEREVLHRLLSGSTEKEIAMAQGRSGHITHGHVKSIYRKFGVSSRAALMALWLGGTPDGN